MITQLHTHNCATCARQTNERRARIARQVRTAVALVALGSTLGLIVGLIICEVLSLWSL